MESKPFRITIEHWDEKVSVETDHSDITTNDAIDMFVNALMAAGFSKEGIIEIFKEYGQD